MPSDERSRLNALRDLAILDTAREDGLDDLVRIASDVCETPIALVSFVDEHRQWFKARIGLDVAETPRDVAFCAHAIKSDELFIVSDATRDPRFANNPLVTAGPHIRFYAGAPLRVAGGFNVGTLCVIDHVPRVLTERQRDALMALRRQVETHLALRKSLRELARSAEREHHFVQFIVHDLRNVIAVIAMNAAILDDLLPDGEEPKAVAADIAEGADSLKRMVAGILDIGRAQDGHGISVAPRAIDLAGMLSALRTTFIRRAEEQRVKLDIGAPPSGIELVSDPDLLRRILENLVDNAIRYAPPSSRVDVALRADGDSLVLTVSDQGKGVPESERSNMFDCYAQGATAARSGHGLGLAFCREATSALGGDIWLAPSDIGCRFCVSLPIAHSMSG